MKVTVVGAGAVGASCAEYIAIKNFASEVVILDIKDGFAEGKAMDLMQTASLNNFDTKIIGTTNDYSITADSNICIITSVGIHQKVHQIPYEQNFDVENLAYFYLSK